MIATIQIDSRTLREAIQKHLDEARSIAARIGPNRLMSAQLDAKIQVLETLIIIISNAEREGELNMEKLSIALGKTIPLDELMEQRGSTGQVKQAILAEAEKLSELVKRTGKGQAIPVDVEKIKPSTFINTTYLMRKNGELPPTIKPMQDKKSGRYYLIHLKQGE